MAARGILFRLSVGFFMTADVMEELRKAMTSFGFMIIQTLVTDIEPDMKVRAAMNEINAAQRLRWAPISPRQP